ncbi:U2 snRNP component prp10 [Malassezia yamatoensis]|uniref:U2 snRNP component prp10 n=1 Tax=Malassezia yamatoensis TaxID=253288 RepID=A0AAJ6CKN0_9BASI|nr:U2 snRNP component prp10 [Malassezia yamatoensis]
MDPADTSRRAGSSRSEYLAALPDTRDDSDSEESRMNPLDQFTAPQHLLNEFADDSFDPMAERVEARQIQSRQSDYHNRRFQRDTGLNSQLDPESKQSLSDEGYRDAMRRAHIEREEERVRRLIQAKESSTQAPSTDLKPMPQKTNVESVDHTPRVERKRRWDVAPEEGETVETVEQPTRKTSRWDETPETDTQAPLNAIRRSRWDETPTQEAAASTSAIPRTAPRKTFITDQELDMYLPKEGYKIVPPPPGYEPVGAPSDDMQEAGFVMPEPAESTGAALPEMVAEASTEVPGIGELAFMKPEDQVYFKKALEEEGEQRLPKDERRERLILQLLLKIKNGTPPLRKAALRQLCDSARVFGAGPLFDKILPLLMERTLEDQERHLLVKVIDRILYRLDDLVRPYVHRILVVIEPLLIDEDYFVRVEGREIISNLAKAAGLAHMISTMRPDIDHADEYVRNTTARALAVVATSLGIPSLMPFLRAVCRSKKSWQARHTAIRVVQQIAISIGCGILPHLRALVDCIEKGLEDEQPKVKTMTALALSALAEASAPYGIESFENVLKPLWLGIRQQRGKGLAAFLKAVGFIIPLMDSDSTLYFVKEITPTLIREFQSADDEMRRIVLKVVKQCASTDGVSGPFLSQEILPEFLRHFWVRRMALDRRNSREVVNTTVELAQKVGVSEIVGQLVHNLKDESEPFRRMAMEAIRDIISQLGTAGVDERLEVLLIDGMTHAFQEQTMEDKVMLDGVGTIANGLGMRMKPYLTQIVSTILWRLNNKNAQTRQQAADLTAQIAPVLKQCGEHGLLSNLGVVLFEQLGEEFPEALASIIAAEGAIAEVVGMTHLNPPVKDLLPRMTPILRNRHERVQEASIQLIGRIADRGAEFVSAREWMRICFELLDLLKAHRKSVRRAAVNSFGFIAKAIGPQDVLQVLLTNLRVQERQSRVCSTVAIAIVAETCGPFTCLPAILNEYRTPESNVQHGCLKALGWIFEYIGEMSKDYVYSVVTLLDDALTDRDPVQRQSAASIVKHLALGTAGLGQEDSMQHLLNLVWPNIFETSPHVINSIMDAIESMRVTIGPGVLLYHTLQGLFHPARKVREIYVRTYNTNYLGAQDALVPYYPNFSAFNTDHNDYQRQNLSVLL